MDCVLCDHWLAWSGSILDQALRVNLVTAAGKEQAGEFQKKKEKERRKGTQPQQFPTSVGSKQPPAFLRQFLSHSLDERKDSVQGQQVCTEKAKATKYNKS